MDVVTPPKADRGSKRPRSTSPTVSGAESPDSSLARDAKKPKQAAAAAEAALQGQGQVESLLTKKQIESLFKALNKNQLLLRNVQNF